jgi:hypothetical protein
MGMVSIVVMERKRREGRGKEERVESNKLWKIILAERLFGQSTILLILYYSVLVVAEHSLSLSSRN